MKTGADFIFAVSGAVALTPRKASGIVLIWKGWYGARDGVTIPPVVARIFSGDSTSPLTRDGHGCPKLNAQSFARMRNNRAFIWQGCWRFSRDSAGLEGQCQCSCTGILTKLLIPCQYGRCFWQYW